MDPVKIGFTGTRSGMTDAQREELKQMLLNYIPFEFHHGDCVGADYEAHQIACLHLGQRIVIHPPIKTDLQARCIGDEGRTPKSYFARNRDIVNECFILFATPYTAEETQGGTWYTINYAIKQKKHVFIIQPDGQVVWR